MGFSTKQTQALQRNLDHRFVRTREANGRELHYIEGWYAISEANRIFGFDGWNRETVESRCVFSRENRGSFVTVYLARVRITVQSGGTTTIREGHGTGEGRGSSPAEAHDLGFKSAETDATKRAFATFGKPFGLALYANRNPGSKAKTLAPEPKQAVPVDEQHFARDDTTPIPRPSRYYGRRNDAVSRDLAFRTRVQQNKSADAQEPSIAPSIAPTSPDPTPGQIDKSALTFGEPKRLRDKAHLRFVASHPCLVCRQQPSDPHHLRFAQPRALGLKVSDEFTVPLCRNHHHQLHRAGNEVAWWHNLNIKPLPIAKELWMESQMNKIPATSQVPPD